MKTTVNAASLKQAVTWTSKAIKSRQALPILDCVMLSADHDGIQVKATDLDVMLSRSVKATVTEASPVCVNAKSLKGYLGKVPKGAMVGLETVTEPYKGLRVWSSVASVILATQNPEDYPLGIHDVEWANAISLDPNAISLKQIAKFADHEQYNNRVVLKCVLVEVYDGGQYRLTTVDGFRLVTTDAIQGDKVAEYLLPAKAAEMMASLKTNGVLAFGSRKYDDGPKDDSTVGYAQFTTDDSAVVSRLTEGKFPDYSQIIPASDRGTWVVFDTQALTERLENLAAVTGKPYLIKLELSKSRAMLSASDSDGNESSTELPIDWHGEEGFAIAFNAKYMLDYLALCSEQTRIMLESSSRPLLIEGNGCVMVVMPMHIKR